MTKLKNIDVLIAQFIHTVFYNGNYTQNKLAVSNRIFRNKYRQLIKNLAKV